MPFPKAGFQPLSNGAPNRTGPSQFRICPALKLIVRIRNLVTFNCFNGARSRPTMAFRASVDLRSWQIELGSIRPGFHEIYLPHPQIPPSRV
jgi:hypothetical protein